jgi:hypothetical protein
VIKNEDNGNKVTIGDGRVCPEHFDPNVLEVFKRIHLELKKIYDEIRD